MPDLDLDLSLPLLTVGVIFLMRMKFLWDELQENNAVSYPDGLNTCPPETYTVDDDSNGVKCISCPTCPVGKEPTPPCGTSLVIQATGECVPCKTGTFSDESDSAACKVCTDCGPRKVMSSCTAERDTECKKCPWWYYEDHATHICKHCSSCCENNLAAQMACITSKTCKGNCSGSTRIKQYFNRQVAKVMNNLYNTTSVSNVISRHKISREKPKPNATIIKANPGESTRSEIVKRDIHPHVENLIEDYMGNTNSEAKIAMSDSSMDTDNKPKLIETTIKSNAEEDSRSEIVKRDIRLNVGNLDDYKNSTNSEAKNAMSESSMDKDIDGTKSKDLSLLLPDIFNHDQEIIDLPRMEQVKESYFSMKSGTKIVNANGVGKEDQIVSTTLQPSVSPTTAQDTDIAQLTPPTPVPLQIPPTSTAATEHPTLINTSSFMSSFSGTIAAFALIGFIGLVIFIVYIKCVRRRPRGYKKLSGTNMAGDWQHIEDDQLDENSNEDEMESSANGREICDQNDANQIVEDLNLSNIPPDLEDILVMRLDVPHGRPESKVYGWQKVGSAAGLSRHELTFYQNEYLRQNGSPTKLLLDKLGSEGKTISYLLDVLQKPRVQLGSVAASIRHRVTKI